MVRMVQREREQAFEVHLPRLGGRQELPMGVDPGVTADYREQPLHEGGLVPEVERRRKRIGIPPGEPGIEFAMMESARL